MKQSVNTVYLITVIGVVYKVNIYLSRAEQSIFYVAPVYKYI